MGRFFFLFFAPLLLFGLEFKVASYNVENLFDTQKSGFEYEEFDPKGKSGWNERMLDIKIKNIARVIKELNADIIALQEVENLAVLKRLNLALGSKKYPYMYRSMKTKGVDSALLSRFALKATDTFFIPLYLRPIHKIVLEIDSQPITLFLNHWPAKKHGDASRMRYAKELERLYSKTDNFILLGDFNAPLEQQTDGWGKSVAYLNRTNYNLWYDIPAKRRYSHAFFRTRTALDHIIISKNLQQKHYIDASFDVFAPAFASDKYANPARWEISNKGKGVHLGRGYSDHFALSASFDTNLQKKEQLTPASVDDLLKTKNLRGHYLLKDVMVIDKFDFGVVLEDTKRNSIFAYKPDVDLKLGEIYTLEVKELGSYKGNREIILLKGYK